MSISNRMEQRRLDEAMVTIETSRVLKRVNKIAVGLAILLVAVISSADAQLSFPSNTRVDRIKTDQVQTLLNQTNASTDLDEDVKKRIVASYEQALQALDSADEATAQLNKFTEMESSPSRQLESVLAQIEALKQPVALPKTSSLSELEQLIQVKVEQLDQDKFAWSLDY